MYKTCNELSDFYSNVLFSINTFCAQSEGNGFKEESILSKFPYQFTYKLHLKSLRKGVGEELWNTTKKKRKRKEYPNEKYTNHFKYLYYGKCNKSCAK